MSRNWYHIAKAEFFVITHKFHRHRLTSTLGIYSLAIMWALFVAPPVMNTVIESFIGWDVARMLLIASLPGTMRSVMLFLWMSLLMIPLSQGLQELKIGHWEIFLSNNVPSHEILLGTFLGKIPLYGLFVLFLAPLIVGPIALAFSLSLFGAIIMYIILSTMVLTTIWLSNFVTAVIQSRLGESARGNDLAKALSFIMALVTLLPLYGLMFLAPTMAELLGMDLFLVFPFTWLADLTTWCVLLFNGIGITESQISLFSSVLQFDLVTCVALAVCFSIVIFVLPLKLAGRVFTIEAGTRTEVVTTITHEHLFFRGLRWIFPSTLGILLVTSLKDYLRKAQNLSKIFYSVLIALIIPIMLLTTADSFEDTVSFLPFAVVMLGLIGTFPFAGSGFLESKHQLWMIQSAPYGASRYLQSRVIASSLVVIFPAFLTALTLCALFSLSLLLAVFFILISLVVVIASTMVAIGITACNPNYEDTKSPAHQFNMIVPVLVVEFTLILSMMTDMIFSFVFGRSILSILSHLFPFIPKEILVSLLLSLSLLLIGSLALGLGKKHLARPG